MTATRKARHQMRGTVVGTAMQKTITVQVTRTYKHPKYGKYVRCQEKFLAHDPEEAAGKGDVVDIVSTRPLSKLKRWRLVRVLERADVVRSSAPEVAEIDRSEVASISESPRPEAIEPEGSEGGES